MTIDEHTIKISAGKIVTDKELEIGSEVKLLVTGEVIKVEDTNNFDGTISRCYVVKGEIAESI